MFSDMSTLWLLQSFNAKLLALYNHYYQPGDAISGDSAGALKVGRCVLEVCSLLRTFKSCKEPLDIDFDPPQLVHGSSPEKYLFIVNLRALRSPSRCQPFRAMRTFKVSYIQQTYRWEQEDQAFGPVCIDMHTLAFQDAELCPVRFNHSEQPGSKAAVSEELLSSILAEYMERLHQFGLSTLIAQSCPSHAKNGCVSPPQPPPGGVPPAPQASNLIQNEFNVYLRVLWQNIITENAVLAGGHSLQHFSGKSGISLSFDGPPAVSYVPHSREVWFRFQASVISATGTTRLKPLWFSVGTLVTSERRGVLIASRIDKDGFRPSCKNPIDVPNGPFKSVVISMIRDEYIPFLWQYGFDVLRIAIDWTTMETMEPQALPDTAKDFHEPRMNSWDFAVSISQTSINANIKNSKNAMSHAFPWSLEWMNPSNENSSGKGKSPLRRKKSRSPEVFAATFTMSRIQLLSDGQAIVWVQVCSEDEFVDDEDHLEAGSAACRLAFHVNLGITSPDEPTADRSMWTVYLGTTHLSFLPRYSTLPFQDDDIDRKCCDLVDFVGQTYFPWLVDQKRNVIARVPILSAATKDMPSPMRYARFHTTFGRRAAAETITVENWFNELHTLSPALLVYGTPHDMDGALAIPPSWNWSPRLDHMNRLSVGTLAFGKEAFIDHVLLAHLARLNEITALVPTAALAYKSSCPHEVYFRCSGDGANATAAMWKRDESHRTDDASSRAYIFERTTSCVEEMIIDAAIQKKTLCECKTNNRLIISDPTSPELTVTMTGDVELVHHHPRGDVRARVTWTWEIMRCTGTDSNVEITSHTTLLDSVKTLPVLENGYARSSLCDKAAGTSLAPAHASNAPRVLAERLRDKLCDVVQNATLPDPLASIRDAVAARGDLLLGNAIRCNNNSDLLVELYPKPKGDTTADAPLPDADADADMDVYI